MKTVVIAKSLSKTEIDVYKPTSVENNVSFHSSVTDCILSEN